MFIVTIYNIIYDIRFFKSIFQVLSFLQRHRRKTARRRNGRLKKRGRKIYYPEYVFIAEAGDREKPERPPPAATAANTRNQLMIFGIVAGLSSAVIQSGSYISSRHFMAKYHSAKELTIYSQLIMGALGLAALPFACPERITGGTGTEFTLWMLLWLIVMPAGQFCFFRTIREIEPSRIASLLGLKIIVLSLIFVFVFRNPLSGGQWLAVLMSTAAAVGMNWSGGSKFTPKGLMYLALTLTTYALADITETRLVRMIDSGNMLYDSVAISAASYGLLGVLTIPALRFVRFDAVRFRAAAPFAVTWLLSMTALFACFADLDTVFGNVVQASRGVIAIGLELVLLSLGFSGEKVAVPPRMWARRILAALLMTAAIIIFSLSGTRG